MGSSRTARRKQRLKILGRVLIAVAGIAFIAWIFYIGATWGPRPVDTTIRQTAGAADPRLIEESEGLERQFEAIASIRDPAGSDLDLLRDAIARQREYNHGGRSELEDRRRLERLENRLAEFVARDLHLESVTAEEEGAQFLESGDIEAALNRHQHAFDLQRRINRNYARSGFRDASRESRLEVEIASIQAQPLHERSVDLHRSGEEAMEAFEWEKARLYLTEALQLQTRINESSRRSSFHSSARVQLLNNQIAQLAVGEMMSEALSFRLQGEEHERLGRWEEAARLYERAMDLQNEINRRHPQSRFVSAEKVQEMDISRQTALSARLGMEFEEVLTKIRQAIGQGDFSAIGDRIETARRLLGQISDRFPRSRYADFNIRLELDYLAMQHRALPELQNLLRENLVPLPGRQEWQMSAKPVSQRLYSRVMGGNPSRNRGDDLLPVDSVTFAQAREFCRRASWILAQPVSLPSRQDFEAAIGEWDPATHGDLSWHQQNSGGSPHPVNSGGPNPHGFFHIVGNVRHWIEGHENGVFWTAGASFADELPADELFQRLDVDLRDPNIGFRYLLRVD